jgi:hypothetical protein
LWYDSYLVCRSWALSEAATLAESNVVYGTTIDLRVRVRDGGGGASKPNTSKPNGAFEQTSSARNRPSRPPPPPPQLLPLPLLLPQQMTPLEVDRRPLLRCA